MTAPTVHQDTRAVKMAIAIVPAWAPAAITARGAAYLRLAELRDVWTDLRPEDRAYFAEDLRELLIDAVCPETAR